MKQCITVKQLCNFNLSYQEINDIFKLGWNIDLNVWNTRDGELLAEEITIGKLLEFLSIDNYNFSLTLRKMHGGIYSMYKQNSCIFSTQLQEELIDNLYMTCKAVLNNQLRKDGNQYEHSLSGNKR